MKKVSVFLPEYLSLGGKLEKLNSNDMRYCGANGDYLCAGAIKSVKPNGQTNSDNEALYEVQFERKTTSSLNGMFIKVKVDFNLSDNYK